MYFLTLLGNLFPEDFLSDLDANGFIVRSNATITILLFSHHVCDVKVSIKFYNVFSN